MKRSLGLAAMLTLALAASGLPALAGAPEPPAGEQQFRALYKELVETNTTLSAGSCSLAAERMAARLKAAGFTDQELHSFVPPAYPKQGGLVAVYAGREPQLKAILLLAHLDVVEAKRDDWTRDPFKLVEENGNFYARGTLDDKAQAAIWVDLLIRFRSEHYRPLRTIKVALTCGEESGSTGPASVNGALWLTENHRDLIYAAFAINEGGGGGEEDAEGHLISMDVDVGEKTYQDFRLEVTNRGGHSSVPEKDNAIYRLAGALKRVEAYTFPAQFSDANRGYFAAMAKIRAARGEATIAAAMTAFLRDSGDTQALALVSAQDHLWNALLRTTCVATMLEAGHAPNALPQRARANVNCRIFPGTSVEAVHAQLEALVADPEVKVLTLDRDGPSSPSQPVPADVMAPIESLTEEFWPAVPVIPILGVGSSDSRFLRASGIPTYGITPLFTLPDYGNVHGLNEYVSVQRLLECRSFLYRLLKIYAERADPPPANHG
jgi:acetylornithine deacetylase/succinyl-diaminopimelate desuccinylase-like protein